MVLTNRHGTAPGIWLEDERGRWCAMLPGVPREMRGMLADELMPRLQERFGTGLTVVRSRTIRTTGIAESKLAEVLGTLASGVDGMSLAYLPGQEGVDLRLTSRDHSASDADQALDRAAAQLRQLVSRYAYGEDATDLAKIVLEACEARTLHIAVAESCTGGLLGARLTAIPGSSTVVLGGVIAYSNEVKSALLGVRQETLDTHGAVSEQVATEMAAGVRKLVGAEIGISITGVAGPGGGTAEKPVGLVYLHAAGPDGSLARKLDLPGEREQIRVRATVTALHLLRALLIGSRDESA